MESHSPLKIFFKEWVVSYMDSWKAFPQSLLQRSTAARNSAGTSRVESLQISTRRLLLCEQHERKTSDEKPEYFSLSLKLMARCSGPSSYKLPATRCTSPGFHSVQNFIPSCFIKCSFYPRNIQVFTEKKTTKLQQSCLSALLVMVTASSIA